jgi:hypothetical protein
LPNVSDFLFSATNIIPNTWVQLTNNATSVAYVSSSASNPNGLFPMGIVPAGTYTVATGPTNVGPWTSTGDASYNVSEFLGYFNVKDYGAKLDNSTDDSAAFQAAINAASAVVGGRAGGVVWVPPGKAIVNTTLTINAPQITVQGSGGEGSGANAHTGSQITFNGTGPLFDIGTDNGLPWDGNYYDGWEGFSLKDITLDTAATTTLDQNGVQKYRPNTYGVRDWRGGTQLWSNVKIIGFDYTFWGVQSDINRWDHVNVQNSHRGVYVGPRSDQFTFYEVYFIYCDRAIEIDRSTPRFDRCIFVDSGAVGTNPIKIHSAWVNGQWGAVFDNCWFEHYIGPPALESWIEFGVGDAVQSSQLQIIKPTILTNTSSGIHMQYLVKVGNATNILIDNPIAQIFTSGAPGTAANIDALVSCVTSNSPDISIKVSFDYAFTNFTKVITSGGATPNVSVEVWGGTRGLSVTSGNFMIGSDIKSAQTALQINSAAAQNKDIDFLTGGTPRWIHRVNNTAETGSDAGSDYQLLSRHDDGTASQTILTITRSSGLTTWGEGINLALGTVTGTKIGTSTTQKLSFFNATPIVQLANTTDLRTGLINLGFLASGGATPLNLNGGILTAGFNLTLSGAAATSRDIILQTSGVNRWIVRMNNTAETGSNVGSDLNIISRDDSGAALTTAVTIARSNGTIQFGNKIWPATDAGATQTTSGLYAGTGAPNNTNGANGDFYFRADGGASTTIYQKRTGAWVGIV